jgi:1-acyl-sn-glycerol-3-phosphate acyltransferase
MLQWFLSLLFWVIWVPYTIFWSIIVGLFALVNRFITMKVIRFWVDSCFWMLRVLCGITYEIEGRENVPEGNHVLYIKHTSTWETMTQMKLFYEQSWVMKRELTWIPFFGWALIAMNPIGIDRNAHRRAVQQVLEQGAKRLADGMWVHIFPEGTRMPPGETRRYGMSGAILAKENGRYIVPIAHNAGDLWPKHSLLKKPGHIRMVIGPPISTDDKTPAEINAAAQAWIEGKMLEISAVYQAKAASVDQPES